MLYCHTFPQSIPATVATVNTCMGWGEVIVRVSEFVSEITLVHFTQTYMVPHKPNKVLHSLKHPHMVSSIIT